jgi:hypothetical protein
MLQLPYESFNITGPHGLHQCLVYEPMHSSLEDNLYHSRITITSAKPLVHRVLQALNYLHTECHIIHTGEPHLLQNVSRLTLDRYFFEEYTLGAAKYWRLGVC